MYRKRFSLVSLSLLIGLVLLSGCYDVEPPSASAPEANQAQPTNTAPTPAPAVMNGCINVKSFGFNMGASEGKTICLEGTVIKVTLSNEENWVRIDLDTTTASNGISLYEAGIFIYDRLDFGMENLDRVVEGTRVAALGVFRKNTLSGWLITITKPEELIIVG